MAEPVELDDIVGHTTSVGDETGYEVPVPKVDENEYTTIDTLAEKMTTPRTPKDSTPTVVGVADVKSEIDTAALRKVQIFCLVLLMMLVISSVTIGVLVNTLMQRTDELQLKINELKSRPGYLTGTDSTNIQELQGKVIQLEKDRSSHTSMIQDHDSRITTLEVAISEIDVLSASATIEDNQKRIIRMEIESNVTDSQLQTMESRLTYLQDGLNCTWGNWTSFSSCSATCGDGLHYRERSLEGLVTDNNQQWCARKEIDIQTCIIKSCKLMNGGWGQWSPFSNCSQACGVGTQTRHRTCDNPEPLYGGAPCLGHTNETQTCYTDQCPEDCSGFTSGSPTDGVYNISPNRDLTESVPVYCEFTSDGDWTVIQKRFNGSVDFYRTWQEYKTGFGDVKGEYWLGNDAIHRLTSHGTYQLKIRLVDWDGNTVFANYASFRIANESDDYRLSIDGYSGNAGNSMGWNNGAKFSTRDVDNDNTMSRDCAVYHKGAWWYWSCSRAHLNGIYHHTPHTEDTTGISWYYWKNTHFYSLKATTMMIQANRTKS